MRRSNCSDPIPPGTPGDITFWRVAPVFLSLYFSLALPYINTIITLFSSAPPFFVPVCHNFVDGGRTIWSAHNALIDIVENSKIALYWKV